MQPIVQEIISSTGQPLDSITPKFMESCIGHDFSRVRVHADARAAESAYAVKVLTYTVGSDMAFGIRQYAPSTEVGRRLLAHELAHVVQQRSAVDQVPSRAWLQRERAEEYELNPLWENVVDEFVIYTRDITSVNHRCPGLTPHGFLILTYLLNRY